MTIEITSCAGKICGRAMASTRCRSSQDDYGFSLAVLNLTKPSYKQVDIVYMD